MVFLPVDIRPLVARARSTLEMTQEEFGLALGASHRSAQRWDAGTAEPGAHQLETLVRLLYPKDAALATQIADAIRETPESLGIVQPAPPAPVGPPPRARPPADLIVESIVCAAAEAVALPPAGVRPALRAAFERAKAMELTVDEVDAVLSPKAPPQTNKAPLPRADGAAERAARRGKRSRGPARG
jgi:hypothetical protein